MCGCTSNFSNNNSSSFNLEEFTGVCFSQACREAKWQRTCTAEAGGDSEAFANCYERESGTAVKRTAGGIKDFFDLFGFNKAPAPTTDYPTGANTPPKTNNVVIYAGVGILALMAFALWYRHSHNVPM